MKGAVKTLKALGDPTRLRILRLLLQRDLCVCELVFILKMEQSRISHQLRILREAELTEDIREGRWIVYRIPRPVRKTLHLLFNEVLRDEPDSLQIGTDDRRRIALCLKEEVRKKRYPS